MDRVTLVWRHDVHGMPSHFPSKALFYRFEARFVLQDIGGKCSEGTGGHSRP
jgi:hypothetical protein